VAEVLDALRTARVNAPILLADQHDSTDTAYVPPKGLEVLLQPRESGAVRAMTLRVGSRQSSDSDLKRHARQGQPVVLQADEETPYDDVVHAVDVCRAAGAKVLLATPKN
jgi:biopolymer transport protein ExbD